MSNLTPEEQAQLDVLVAKQTAPAEPVPEPVTTEPPPPQLVPAEIPAEGPVAATEPAATEPAAAGDWQPQDPSGAPVGPVTPPASSDPAAAAQETHPDEVISPSTYEVVEVDGSTAKTTPVYSTVPCPVCGNTTLKTTNVEAATPIATLQGKSVNPGDQIVLCDSCHATITAGDLASYEQQAHEGVFGPEVQASAQGENAATLELDDERAQIERQRQALADQQAALDQREQSLQAEQERIAAANTPTGEGGGAGGNA